MRRCRRRRGLWRTMRRAWPEHDAGLVAGGGGDVDLGLGLAVGDEEVEAGGGGHPDLPFLRGRPRPTSV